MARSLSLVLLIVASAQLTAAFAPASSLPLVQSRGRTMALRPSMALESSAAPAAASIMTKAAAAAPLAAAQASMLVRPPEAALAASGCSWQSPSGWLPTEGNLWFLCERVACWGGEDQTVRRPRRACVRMGCAPPLKKCADDEQVADIFDDIGTTNIIYVCDSPSSSTHLRSP
jgi:hypothetical protein